MNIGGDILINVQFSQRDNRAVQRLYYIHMSNKHGDGVISVNRETDELGKCGTITEISGVHWKFHKEVNDSQYSNRFCYFGNTQRTTNIGKIRRLNGNIAQTPSLRVGVVIEAITLHIFFGT